MEPLCSLSCDQQEELTSLLTRVQSNENDLRQQVLCGISSRTSCHSDSDNNSEECVPGVAKILKNMRKTFKALHRQLDVREEELAADITSKSKSMIQIGLTQFESDTEKVKTSTSQILFSHLLRASQVSRLFEDTKDCLEDSLALFQELPALPHTLQLSALELVYDKELKLLIGDNGQLQCLQKSAPQRVKVEVLQTSRSLAITWCPPTTISEETSPLIHKYFNNDASFPAVAFYNVKISVDDVSVIGTVSRHASAPLYFQHRLDPERLQQNHAVQVQAVCIPEGGHQEDQYHVGGTWSEAVQIIPQPWSAMPVRASSQPNPSALHTSKCSGSASSHDVGSPAKKRKRDNYRKTSNRDDSCDDDDDNNNDDNVEEDDDDEDDEDESDGGGDENYVLCNRDAVAKTHPNIVLTEMMKGKCIRKFKDYNAVEVLVENAGIASGVYRTVSDIIPGRTMEQAQYWVDKFRQEKVAAPLWWMHKPATATAAASAATCGSSVTSVTSVALAAPAASATAPAPAADMKRESEGAGDGIYFCLTRSIRRDKQYNPAIWHITIPKMDALQPETIPLFFTYVGRTKKKKPVDVYAPLKHETWRRYEEHTEVDGSVSGGKGSSIVVSIVEKKN